MAYFSNNVALTPKPTPIAPALGPQRRILLVEDNSAIRNALQRILERAGCQVDPASTVAEGMRLLDGQDCILLDLNLPDGLGSTILQHVRKNGLSIRVAVMTACRNPSELAELSRAKPDAWFTKPVVLTELLDWVETVPCGASPLHAQGTAAPRASAQRAG